MKAPAGRLGQRLVRAPGVLLQQVEQLQVHVVQIDHEEYSFILRQEMKEVGMCFRA